MAAIKILTIDPGMNTGWAMWQYGDEPISTGVFRQAKFKNKVLPLRAQLNSLWEQFGMLMLQLRPDEVIIESAGFWPGASKSHAALFSGDLTKMLLLIGGYCHKASSVRIPWELVEPSKWKGQLTETALHARIERRIGKTFRQHEQEAVGIGLWRRGIL